MNQNEKLAYKELLSAENFTFKRIGDRIILFLNRWSNNYQTSWLRGVYFTIIVSLFFYGLLILLSSNYINSTSLNNNPLFQCFSKYYFTFLWPTHRASQFLEELKSNVLSIWFYIFYFLGRIFIGYGIYQTIQAFRKIK